jgi:hypothetical protein
MYNSCPQVPTPSVRNGHHAHHASDYAGMVCKQGAKAKSYIHLQRARFAVPHGARFDA